MRTYAEALLERGNNFALHMDGGWVFGKVLDIDRTISMVYNRFNTLGPQSYKTTVGSETTGTAWHVLEDDDEHEYLYEKYSNKLIQAFIGISPSPLKLFWQYPAATPRGTLGEILLKEPFTDETPGAIDGYMSPFTLPTEAGELMIPKEVRIALGLYNPTSYNVNPVLKFMMQRMEVRYLDPDNSADMSVIESIQNGGRCKFWSPGLGLWDYGAISQLGIKPVPEWR